MSKVDIGFPEDCEPWQVKSRFFPSKIGGKPAWLAHENLPSVEDLKCTTCDKQLKFLCQVYAPFEESENNFHRILYIFVCGSPPCCIKNKSSNVKVFRNSLPRKNDYYPFEPPKDEPIEPDLLQSTKLCNLCGCFAEKHCSSCKTAVYCCRDHQVLDWKENHKTVCNKSAKEGTGSNYLYPEFEILIEHEEYDAKNVDEDEEIKNFEELKSLNKLGSLADVEDKDLEQHAFDDKDKIFYKFKKRIDLHPDQILRYERGGKPLWIAKEPLPDVIPSCEYCKGPREFEFQIMPQVLSTIKENDLDFGVLAVYSCKSSCTIDFGYKNEYVFKQDVSEW